MIKIFQYTDKQKRTLSIGLKCVFFMLLGMACIALFIATWELP